MKCGFALLVLLAPVSVLAQDVPSSGFLDVDVLSVRSLQGTDSVSLRAPLWQETAVASATYPELGRAFGAGVSGGLTAGSLGFGVRWMRTTYDQTVGLSVSIPHPLLFNRNGTDADVTDAGRMRRQESALDLSAVYVLPIPSSAWRVRLVGGPTYFTVAEDRVERIRYTQFFTLTGTNEVNITTYTPQEVEGTTWGYHAGLDVAYFFTRYVGAGGGLRVNSGSLDIEADPLTTQRAELSVGQTALSAGLRLRF